MDLERIKQNLRLRSGRTKKTRKGTQVISAATTKQANGEVPEPARIQASSQKTPREEPRIGRQNPQKDLNTEDAPIPRPDLPQASMGTGTDNVQQSSNARNSSKEDIKPQTGEESTSQPPNVHRTMTDPHATDHQTSDDPEAADFDLRPPSAKPKPPSLETLAVELFSGGHLDTVLHSPALLARFTAFLNKYTPDFYPTLIRYLELQKATKAVEYANAVAEGIKLEGNDKTETPKPAATLDNAFQEACTQSFQTLVSTALPMYITYNLVKMVSECLIDEITGRQAPIMRDLVGGLSEVFCLTDPRQDDNPIIYASQEFYRLTGYGRDDVIGNNCRFLQGAKTKRESVIRLKESTQKGEELCETLLNYRRDGRPFINLLMIAPLLDDKGNVKYHIGAQVDVSRIVEGGRALDSFENYLRKRQFVRGEDEHDQEDDEAVRRRKTLSKLRELSETFDLEESAVVQSHSRSNSMTRDADEGSIESRGSLRARRRFVDEDPSDDDDDDEETTEQDKADWKLSQSALSGKLPGVYDSYMLIRPAPSLRIIFVSPKLRRLGNVIQSPFLAHVSAPAGTLSGLKESFSTGSPVSAKINFMAKRSENRDGTPIGPGTRHEDGTHGRACWISATPLLGEDDRVGVWMIVVVQKSKAPRRSRRQDREPAAASETQTTDGPAAPPSHIDIPDRTSSQNEAQKDDLPIKPKRLEEEKADSHEVSQEEAQKAWTYGPDPEPQSHDSGEAADHAHDGSSHQDEENREFVQTRERRPPMTPQRTYIQPDSDAEQDTPVTARKPDNAYPQIPTDVTTPPNEIPPSVPSDAQFEDASDTISPSREDNAEESKIPSPSSTVPETESHSGRPLDRKPYMDYLSHPGSQPNAEYARAASGSGFVPTRAMRDVYGDRSKGDFPGTPTDADCVRSPYSVD